MDNEFTIKVQSLEYLPVQVLSQRDGAPYDPTDDVVEIALPVINEDPTEEDWNEANWQTIDANESIANDLDKYYARVLVGPGGIELDVGDYDIITRITDSPEIPVLRAGILHII